jgi:hypothetical protein
MRTEGLLLRLLLLLLRRGGGGGLGRLQLARMWRLLQLHISCS